MPSGCVRSIAAEATETPLEAGENLRAAIERHLDQLLSLSEQQLREARYSKFRAMGRFLEKTSQDVDKAA